VVQVFVEQWLAYAYTLVSNPSSRPLWVRSNLLPALSQQS